MATAAMSLGHWFTCIGTLIHLHEPKPHGPGITWPSSHNPRGEIQWPLAVDPTPVLKSQQRCILHSFIHVPFLSNFCAKLTGLRGNHSSANTTAASYRNRTSMSITLISWNINLHFGEVKQCQQLCTQSHFLFFLLTIISLSLQFYFFSKQVRVAKGWRAALDSVSLFNSKEMRECWML